MYKLVDSSKNLHVSLKIAAKTKTGSHMICLKYEIHEQNDACCYEVNIKMSDINYLKFAHFVKITNYNQSMADIVSYLKNI